MLLKSSTSSSHLAKCWPDCSSKTVLYDNLRPPPLAPPPRKVTFSRATISHASGHSNKQYKVFAISLEETTGSTYNIWNNKYMKYNIYLKGCVREIDWRLSSSTKANLFTGPEVCVAKLIKVTTNDNNRRWSSLVSRNETRSYDSRQKDNFTPEEFQYSRDNKEVPLGVFLMSYPGKMRYDQASLYKQKPPFGAKICWDICPRTLSVPRCEQFSESEARGKLWANM